MNVKLCEIFQLLNCGCEMREAMILALMKGINAIAYMETCRKSGL